MGDKITNLYTQFENAKRRGDVEAVRSISSEAAMLSGAYKENTPEWNACQDLCVEADEVIMDFEEEDDMERGEE